MAPLDVADDVDAVADAPAVEVTLDAGPEPEPLPPCPSGEPLDVAPSVVPLPRAVYAWGEVGSLDPASLTFQGLTEADQATADRLDVPAWRSGSDGGAGLEVVLHDTARWDALVATCGLDAGTDVAEAYLLDVRPDGERWRADVVAKDAAGRLHGLRTLAQLVDGGRSRRASVLDRPAAPGRPRGVIEGFYGEPWSREARLAMIGEIADLKMNAFVYAPKADPWINLAWAEPYPQEELDHVRAVAEEAARHGVRVCWELRPAWPADFSSEEDRAAMVAKFLSIAEQGVTCLVLAFDDLNKQLLNSDASESYTAGQAAFANAAAEDLLAAHPDLMLGFVPVEYWTGHEDTATDLAWLAEHLGPAWEIAWTGPRIISPTLTAADLEEIEAVLGEPPLLGDNYPVSDAAPAGSVHLGPLVGRDAAVLEGVGGALFNAMSLPFASLPALATAADQAWGPARYDPEASMHRAVALYAATVAQGPFAALVGANRSATLESSPAPGLRQDLDALWAAWEAGDEAAVASAAQKLRADHLGPFQATPTALDAVHPDVAAELRPWAERLAAYGLAAEDALALLQAAVVDGTPDAEAVQALADAAASLAEPGPRPTGGELDTFLARALDALEGA